MPGMQQPFMRRTLRVALLSGAAIGIQASAFAQDWKPLRPVRVVVMSAGPGRIIDDTTVPFARPRTIEQSYSPEFVTMTQRLRELIIANRPQKEAA